MKQRKAFKIKSIVISSIVVLGMALSSFSVFGEASSSIKDLDKSSSYARQAIMDLAGKNIITGDSKGNFNPGQDITRAQMVTILVRVMGLSIQELPAKATFRDVPVNHWAFPYVEAAYKAGIINGLSKDSFGVNEPCSREQMTAIFVRALGISTGDIDRAYGTQSIDKLADISKISAWSRSYVEFALSTGLMTGTSSKTFSPWEHAKREQAAVVTDRFIHNKDDITILPSKDGELTSAQIAALEKGTVTIRAYDEAGVPVSTGSGFAVAKGLFLTSYHLLEGARTYTITDSSGKAYDVLGIVKYDPDVNLAVIKTKELTDIPALKMGTKSSAEKADRIAVISNPQGQQNLVSQGIVSGIRKFRYGENGSADILQITASLSGDRIGGPLCDMKGKVIGVADSISADGNLKFAVAIDHALGWIQELQGKSFESIKVLDMSQVTAGYLDTSDESIKALIYKSFRALEEKDINAYMTTVHPLAPGYKLTKEEMGKILKLYDFDFDILELDILQKQTDKAEVELVYTIKRLDMQETDTLRVYGDYLLQKRNGEWKIYLASELVNEYPKETRYDTGIGAITKEEALWAYEEATKNTPQEGNINGTALKFTVTDSIIHPDKPVIFFSDKTTKKVYAYNYATGQTKEAGFTLPPESIALAGNEIYVALLKGEHSPYWFTDDQKGAIAILDSETLQIKEQFDIAIDPYAIVAGKDGYIYVTSGSGQHTQLKSYSRTTLKEAASTGVDAESYALLHPTKNIIYTTNNSSPMDMVMYNISQGKFTDPAYPGGVDSPYHGDYDVGKRFIFSPDGNYLINSAGTVFSTGSGLLGYYNTLGREFTDIVFAPDGKSFFTGIKGGLIYEYTYPGFKPTNTYKVQGEIVRLYCRGNQLMAVTKANNKYYIETVGL